jgi:hypothetical protein
MRNGEYFKKLLIGDGSGGSVGEYRSNLRLVEPDFGRSSIKVRLQQRRVWFVPARSQEDRHEESGN